MTSVDFTALAREWHARGARLLPGTGGAVVTAAAENTAEFRRRVATAVRAGWVPGSATHDDTDAESEAA